MYELSSNSCVKIDILAGYKMRAACEICRSTAIIHGSFIFIKINAVVFQTGKQQQKQLQQII